MNFDLWFAFLMACIVLAVSPGAGAVNMMSITMKYGFRRSVISNLGLQVGNMFNIAIVGVGLGAVLAQSEVAFNAIKWVGALYLIYLGIKKFTETVDNTDYKEHQQKVSGLKMFCQSVIVNVTNPKSIVFLVALLPQFIVSSSPHVEQILVLGSTLLTVDMLVMFGYALLASRLSGLVKNRRHMIVQNRIFGSVFIGTGSLLALAGRS
ncbi:homoserine/homoserine lactone efflux protein [Vibrio sp. IB15]|uniref:Homoserine/homoserine lactone efflux protein n=1 Tax=Vibrio chagasii TaxID=170679 RepID=A0A7V7NWG2_9VIBR|nr:MULTISPECIES: homoserine/homoserine lactone efflux protein [Vibrio]KAB0481928.1 homoserine/homoserine lactone efflux protein [Vibrio chagasii]MBJ2146171.1 homoserine/homoserine lactone efflux protein [Vibrio sp. IB15]